MSKLGYDKVGIKTLVHQSHCTKIGLVEFRKMVQRCLYFFQEAVELQESCYSYFFCAINRFQLVSGDPDWYLIFFILLSADSDYQVKWNSSSIPRISSSNCRANRKCKGIRKGKSDTHQGRAQQLFSKLMKGHYHLPHPRIIWKKWKQQRSKE